MNTQGLGTQQSPCTLSKQLKEQAHILPFLLAPQMGSQSGHHKTHLYQRTVGQCKGYGSKPYIDGPEPMWTKQQKVGGSTAELGVPHKAFSRLLEMVTIMLQLKLLKKLGLEVQG